MSIYGNFINEVTNNIKPKEDDFFSTKGRIIEKITGFFDEEKGLYNALVKVEGEEENLRGRSEMVLLDATKKRIFMELKKDNTYKLPGGGWDQGEDHMACAIRETQEEIRMNSAHVLYVGNYINYYKDAYNCLKYPKETRWIGSFSEVYCGVENGVYKIKIDDKDQDDLFWKGRFYDIEEVFDILKPIHQKAVRMQQKYDADKEN